MKTNLTDDEKVFMDWMDSLIRRNTSVALEILKEKHYHDSNFNKKLDLNDPVVKFVFKIHPEFKKIKLYCHKSKESFDIKFSTNTSKSEQRLTCSKVERYIKWNKNITKII